jgi:hypothetical protein
MQQPLLEDLIACFVFVAINACDAQMGFLTDKQGTFQRELDDSTSLY